MSGQPSAGDLVLAIDTSTRSSVVAIGRDRPEAVSRRDVRHRHGSHLLAQIDEALDSASASIDDVTAVAVGTGPGSFTGLRVGLATAKTIAYARSLPLIAVMSTDALRQAAVSGADSAADIAVVLPAGAHDHYLARAGEGAVLVDLAAAFDAIPAEELAETYFMADGIHLQWPGNVLIGEILFEALEKEGVLASH